MAIATPRSVKWNKLHTIPRDNVATHSHWFMVDCGEVVLCAQRDGEEPTGKVKIPRRAFNRFIDWYNDGQWPRPRNTRRKR